MRTVIEEENVSDIIDREQALYPRLTDAFDALKWWLAHRPESGELIDDINWIYKQLGDQNQTIPALVAIYTFDHWSVTIKFILVRIPSIP
jgi:hypothetical protein